MRVIYPGAALTRHICLGKYSVMLEPGLNIVTEKIGKALVADGMCVEEIPPPLAPVPELPVPDEPKEEEDAQWRNGRESTQSSDSASQRRGGRRSRSQRAKKSSSSAKG